jgi:iron-sulfur cluster repair protein YtfE (RIC family)
MLTTIGRRASREGLIELLLACHARIRAFTDIASRIAAASEAPEADIADAAKRVHRYFAIALPLHVEDEERSLAPRLAGLDAAVGRELVAMTTEHAEHVAPLARLLDLTAELASTPSAHARLAAALASTAAELTRQFEPHLRREEAVIFPAVERLLDAETQAAVFAELRQRREDGAGSAC